MRPGETNDWFGAKVIHGPWPIEWTEHTDKMMERIFAPMINELVPMLMEQGYTQLYFPWGFWARETNDGVDDGYGGELPDDPLTMHLGIDTGTSENAMVFEFDLRRALAQQMDPVEHSNTYGLGTIAAELRKLADEIDARIEGLANETR